MLFPTALEVLY